MSTPPHARIFIVKVASRCNLACTYCYMYQHADQSWVTQPRFMTQATVRRLAGRLEAHAAQFDLGSILVVAHGGEPLLYPDLDSFFSEIRRMVTSCAVEFSIQTNGTLLDEPRLDTLRKHDVHIGISVDGTREAHDRARVDHAGRGSYDAVRRGLALARERAPHLTDSVLQVIDPTVPPKEMLAALESYDVPRADLLFPDLNHDTLPRAGIARGQIGEWLCEVFDEWVQRENGVHIRLFTTIMQLVLGKPIGTDQLGAHSTGAIMVETDGKYHVYDGLRTAFAGAGATGMSVYDTPIDIVENLPLAQAFCEKSSAAAAECLRCNLFPVCGGGCTIHRYRGSTNSFEHPSVYCADLARLITHIARYVETVRPARRAAVRQFTNHHGTSTHTAV